MAWGHQEVAAVCRGWGPGLETTYVRRDKGIGKGMGVWLSKSMCMWGGDLRVSVAHKLNTEKHL